MKRTLLIFFALLLLGGSAPVRTVLAQTPTQSATLQSVEDQKKKLEAELAELEAEIAAKQLELKGQKGKSTAISSEISLLASKIKSAKVKIQDRDLIIRKLTGEIGEKSNTIVSLSDKLDRERDSLAQLIRRTSEIDQANLVHLLLAKGSLSDFYKNYDSYESIQSAVKYSVDEIKGIRVKTEDEKKSLEQKQNAELDARKELEAEQRQKERDEAEQKKLLGLSKNKEKEYEAILKAREKKAGEIRAALFALRDTAAIPFGEALKYAQEVQNKTGVRPAFILAILTQESNLGVNVGQCLVKDFVTGDGVGKNTGRFFDGIMKPSRDIPPFLEIAEKLGFDPKMQPVSCPQPGGYGGAMGPSQFIPSTWAGIENRIAAMTGVSVPNPWAPRDAFFASGIYLADLGASAGVYSAEFEAAARYYAGGNWRTSGQGYANSVMKHAQNIQENMINLL